METKENKTETVTREVVVARTCDICKAPMSLHSRPADVSVEMAIRHSDFDGGGRTSEFDVCAECWDSKVLPWMATFGATPREFDF